MAALAAAAPLLAAASDNAGEEHEELLRPDWLQDSAQQVQDLPLQRSTASDFRTNPTKRSEYIECGIA